jgi:CDP-diacylglycerol--glycerol-3-phosphate 3-phosphatidyltransferase
VTSVAAPVSAWNIANALTALRIVLVPVFGWMLLHDGGDSAAWRIAAAATFIVAAITDRLDGDIARRRNLITDFGKIADPIADKALIGTALVGLSILGELWWWVTIVVLVRELGITLMRFVVIRHGVMPAGRGGKAKTVAQTVAIVLYVLPLPGAWWVVAAVAMAIAVALTVLTGLDYVAQAVRMRSGSERTRLRAEERARPGTPE